MFARVKKCTIIQVDGHFMSWEPSTRPVIVLVRQVKMNAPVREFEVKIVANEDLLNARAAEMIVACGGVESPDSGGRAALAGVLRLRGIGA